MFTYGKTLSENFFGFLHNIVSEERKGGSEGILFVGRVCLCCRIKYQDSQASNLPWEDSK